jgi:hypothetical protein
MTSFNANKIKINQKDIEKGQKIVAAIYLITNHLSDNDPIRQSLRSLSASFVTSSPLEQKTTISQIEILLGSAVLAGLISEKNSSIVIYEAKHFYSDNSAEEVLGSLFGYENSNHLHEQSFIKDIKKTSSYGLIPSPKRPNDSLSYIKNHEKNIINKDSRQNKILSFINERKSAVIKDIVLLFPEVSEKTIQRELGALIDSGRITKRGSKRWSIYMAVNSLL